MKYSRNINTMIMDAMKNGEKSKAETYKALKNEFMKVVTAKGAKFTEIKEIPDSEEIRILNKMVKERTEAADIYEKNDRKELAFLETLEATYLSALLPTPATEEDIEKAVQEYIEQFGSYDKKGVGLAVKFVKEHLENVDGKMAFAIAMKHTI